MSAQIEFLKNAITSIKGDIASLKSSNMLLAIELYIQNNIALKNIGYSEEEIKKLRMQARKDLK